MLTGLEKMWVTVDEVGTKFGPSKNMFPAKTPTLKPTTAVSGKKRKSWMLEFQRN